MRDEETRKLLRKIDYIFYHEQEIRLKIKEYREDPIRIPLAIKPSNKNYSDSTGNTVVRKLMEIRRIWLNDGRYLKKPEKWLKVIEATYSSSEKQTVQIARAQYSKKHREETCSLLNISLSMYYRKLNGFRRQALSISKKFFLKK